MRAINDGWPSGLCAHGDHDLKEPDCPTLGASTQRYDECAANARLIAAAPELLAALQGLLDIVPDWKCECVTSRPTCAWCNARAAIAKAEGK